MTGLRRCAKREPVVAIALRARWHVFIWWLTCPLAVSQMSGTTWRTKIKWTSKTSWSIGQNLRVLSFDQVMSWKSPQSEKSSDSSQNAALYLPRPPLLHTNSFTTSACPSNASTSMEAWGISVSCAHNSGASPPRCGRLSKPLPNGRSLARQTGYEVWIVLIGSYIKPPGSFIAISSERRVPPNPEGDESTSHSLMVLSSEQVTSV